MRQFSATVCAAFALVSLFLVAHAQGPAASSAGRASRQSYHVPRTPWGDPDLEGSGPAALPPAFRCSVPSPSARATRSTMRNSPTAWRRPNA